MATTDGVMTVAQIREAERLTMESVPEEVLMDRAAAAVAAACGAALDQASGVPGARVAVLVGGGNNGGDALLAGAILAGEGASVTAVRLADRVHARGAEELVGAGGAIVGPAAAAPLVASADLVIDGIVGIGSRPGLRDDAEALVALVRAPVVAVDLPSGLDADSGDATLPHVHADATVTFTALKRCLVDEPAAASCGTVVLADVGIELG